MNCSHRNNVMLCVAFIPNKKPDQMNCGRKKWRDCICHISWQNDTGKYEMPKSEFCPLKTDPKIRMKMPKQKKHQQQQRWTHIPPRFIPWQSLIMYACYKALEMISKLWLQMRIAISGSNTAAAAIVAIRVSHSPKKYCCARILFCLMMFGNGWF